MQTLPPDKTIRRREFLCTVGMAGAALLAGCAAPETSAPSSPGPSVQGPSTPVQLTLNTPTPKHTQVIAAVPTTPAATAAATVTGTPNGSQARIALVKTTDRAEGVRQALALYGLPAVQGKSIFLKPNYNSADPAPGSTHPDVLRTLVTALQAEGAGHIVVGERSGMGDTRQVMEQLGVFDMAQELGFEVLVLDELDVGGWQQFNPSGSHWSRGFALPRPMLEADTVVQTCCLKTHRFGGHFTLSLKNSVGLAAKSVPGEEHNYMGELHDSPDQRRMIAEINGAYAPSLIVLDGVEAFRTGGPDTGDKVAANVVLAGSDRVAIDAAGVALLRLLGTTPAVSEGPIFAQEQLARAVELGLGITSGDQIEFVTADAESTDYAAQLAALLKQ